MGLAIGIAGAFLVHGAAAAKGITTLVYMAQFASSVESTVQERLRATYDVNFEPPPEVSTPEEQPEEKQPEKTPPKQEAPKDDKVSDNPYDDPAPEAAQAGKVLTADPDPDAPLDLTGDGFVTGTGDHYAGGTTASNGTSETAVRNPKAKAGGQKGGTGDKPGPAVGTGGGGKDLSRAAGLVGGGNWNDCGFPAAADMEQIDYAVVTIAVTVDASGRAKNVSVLSDPGYGFGALARSCAFRKSYTAGTDKAGNPVAKTTPPIRVRFTR